MFRPDTHQIEKSNLDPHQSDKLDPDPNQSDKLDPDQFVDDTPKFMEVEPI